MGTIIDQLSYHRYREAPIKEIKVRIHDEKRTRNTKCTYKAIFDRLTYEL